MAADNIMMWHNHSVQETEQFSPLNLNYDMSQMHVWKRKIWINKHSQGGSHLHMNS